MAEWGGNLRDALIGNGAVINIIQRASQLIQAKVDACASRQENVLCVFDSNLLGPSG